MYLLSLTNMGDVNLVCFCNFLFVFSCCCCCRPCFVVVVVFFDCLGLFCLFVCYLHLFLVLIIIRFDLLVLLFSVFGYDFILSEQIRFNVKRNKHNCSRGCLYIYLFF